MQSMTNLAIAAAIGLTLSPALSAASPSAPRGSGAFYSEGITHRAPSGYLRLCRSQPHICGGIYDRSSNRGAATTDRVELTGQRRSELSAVNSRINRKLRPVNDTRDTWTVATRYGDCEDFALAKREELVALGWPRAALRLAVGETRGGVPHAVLIARTSQGDFVLDNLTQRVMPISQTSHNLWAVESAKTLGMWSHLQARGHTPRTAQGRLPRVETEPARRRAAERQAGLPRDARHRAQPARFSSDDGRAAIVRGPSRSAERPSTRIVTGDARPVAGLSLRDQIRLRSLSRD